MKPAPSATCSKSYLARFREATTRENLEAVPSDARIISRAIVSNIPAFPKKLPIVLIATLATLLLSAGAIVTGELLNMTAPRGSSTDLAPSRPVAFDGDRSCRPTPRRRRHVAAASAPMPRMREPELAAPIADLERIVAELRAQGDAARKITVMGIAQPASTSLTALTLARLLGTRRQRRAGRRLDGVRDDQGGDDGSVSAGLERSRGRHGVVRADHRQGPDVECADRRRRNGQGGCGDAAVAAACHDHRCA